MTTHTVDSDFSPKEWNAYLERNVTATVYHTLEWRSILEDIFRYKTSYVVSRDIGGDVSGILPLALVKSRITGNRVVSLPFSQYAGPIFRETSAFEPMVRYLKDYLNHDFDYVRLRGKDLFSGLLPVQYGFKSSEYYSRCVIPIANRSDDEIWQALDKGSVRWAIKKSFSEGITVEVSDRMGDSDRMKDLVFQTTKKHGVPTYSPRLVPAISDLASSGLAKVFLAKLEQKVVGVMVLFTMHKQAIYAYNFSDVRFLRFYPNNALIWTAIKWCIDNGFSAFDMGTSSREDDELLSFKTRWGTVVSGLDDFFMTRCNKLPMPDRRASLKYKAMTFTWRFLVPNFIASRAGPRLLHHLE